MNRRLFGVLLVGAAAFAISACSSSDVAATVNETEIMNEDVAALRPDPVGDVVDGEAFRNDLTILIVTQATVDAAEEELPGTEFDTAEARRAFLETATPEELAAVDSVRDNPEWSASAVDVLVTQLAVRSAVVGAVLEDPEILERVWIDQQQQLIEVCARHVLVASEAEALDAKARIEAGESFGDVANEVSLDTFSPNGELPCPSNPASFVEPFGTVVATSQVGVITEPFQTEFGWHIVIVDDRAFPATFEDFVANAERWVPQAVVLGAWVEWRDEAVEAAEVVVRSQIGRWFPPGDGILPPPDSPTVGNASASPGAP